MSDLYLGIDIGTSGVRTAVVDDEGNVISTARAPHHASEADLGPGQADAENWWRAVTDCLETQVTHLRGIGHSPASIRAASVDGTSGSMVLVDKAVRPVTPGLMYNSAGFEEEAAQIDGLAPEASITRGSGSALARMLRLQSYDDGRRATWLCHQADFILAKLAGHAGFSDDNNALKTGFDPETTRWPDWFDRAGVRTELLPKVTRVGTQIGTVSTENTERFGLSPNLALLSGTTDSTAAFLATGANEVGDAVTSLGTTLAIKMLSEVRVDDPVQGIYSHRVGDSWLVGGASNTGGGVLLEYFSPEQMIELSASIDPSTLSGLDYYPLIRPGERFPINDPAFPPRLSPRPDDDALFFKGMLEGITRIEKQGYDALAVLGGPLIKRLFTAGGGAQNSTWTEMRRKLVSANLQTPLHSEASVGVAFMVLQSMKRQAA